MRKICILLFILVQQTLFAINQINECPELNSRTYKVSLKKNYICYLTIVNNNYEITVEHSLSNDMVYNLLLSKGKIKCVNNLLILNDIYNRFSINFKIQGNKLKSIGKSFYILKSRDLELLNFNAQLDYEFDEKQTNKFTHKTEIQTKINKLYWGEYTMGNSSKVVMKIIKPNKYEYYYGDIILSKGTFTRSQNKLILKDQYLKHNLFFVINKNSLVDQFLPLAKDIVLYRSR